MATVVDVSKGQRDMSYKGELQTFNNVSMRHQVCPDETISQSFTITMLVSRGRRNCGFTYYDRSPYSHPKMIILSS